MKEDELTQTSDFWNGSLSRRAFLGRVALVTGGSVVALACGAEATAIPPTKVPPTPVSTAASEPTVAPSTSRVSRTARWNLRQTGANC